jgi:hypothetical protein
MRRARSTAKSSRPKSATSEGRRRRYVCAKSRKGESQRRSAKGLPPYPATGRTTSFSECWNSPAQGPEVRKH